MTRHAARRPAPFQPRLEILEDRIALNAAPTITVPVHVSAGEGRPISWSVTASDTDGDSLTYSVSTLPIGVSLNPTTGLVSGIVGLNNAAWGTSGATFTCSFSVSDGNGGTDSAIRTWAVCPYYLHGTTWYGSEGSTFSQWLSAFNPNVTTTLTYSASGLPQGISVAGATPSSANPVTFTGLFGYANAASGTTATLTATVTVADGIGGTQDALVTWIIEDTNRLPSLPDQAHLVGASATLSAAGTDNTGTNSLTYSASDLPLGLTINPATGMIGSGIATNAASPGTVSPHYPVVTLSDDHGGTDTRAFYWAVSNPTYSWSQSLVPAPEISSISAQSVAEGGSLSLAVVASDPNTYSLTYSATGLPEGLSINPTTGLITGEPGHAAAGEYDVAVRVANGQGAAAVQHFALEVSDSPRAPTISGIADQSAAAGEPVSLQVEVGNPDSQTLAYSATGLPDGLGIDPATGLISGTLSPSAARLASYVATVLVDDWFSAQVSQTFSFTVALSNHIPYMPEVPNLASAAGDRVSLPLSATDPNGDVITYNATGLPDGLVVSPATGEVHGTIANAAAGGTFTVTLSYSDGQLTDARTFLWAVAPVGLAEPYDQVGLVGDTVSLAIEGSTAGTDALTYSASSLPSGLTLNPSTGLITGTLAAAATSSVTLTASDGTDSASRTFTWSVARLDLDNPGLQQGTDGASASLQLEITDVGGTPTYSASGLPSGLTLNPSTGLITGTLGIAAHGSSPYRVTVTATDSGASDTETFFWTVKPKVALLNPGRQASAAGDTVSLALTGGAATGTLTFSVSGLPTGLSINASTGLITGTLGTSTAQANPYLVTLTASDGSAQNSTRFHWSVADLLLPAPGDRSNLDADSVSLALGAHYHGTATLTYGASGLPSGLTLNAGTGLITGTLASDAHEDGPYRVTATATAGTHTVTQSFVWHAGPRVLTHGIGDLSSVGGDTVSLDLSAGHAASGTLTYSVTGLPSGLSLNASTGLVTGTIATGAVSPTPATVTLTTGDGTVSVGQTFHWSVAGVGIDDWAFVDSVRNQSISLSLSARAASGAVTYGAVGLPWGLSLNASTGLISGTPTASGKHLVGVTATQGAYSASDTFEYDVREADLANPGDRSNREGAGVSLSLQAASASGGSFTYSVDGLPDGLSLNPSNGLISGTLAPDSAANGPYEVVVAVSDGTAASQQQFTWTVTPYVELTAVADRAGVEGDTVSLAVVATDFGSLTLSYSANGLPDGLSINASTGLISGTIATGASLEGPSWVLVTADDGTYSSSDIFRWDVTPASPPAAPSVTNPGMQAFQAGDVVELQVVASDAAGYELSYSATGLPKGLQIDPYTGVISGVLDADAASATPYEVTVTADDGVGQQTNQTFSWLLNASSVVVDVTGITQVEGRYAELVATVTTSDLTIEAEAFVAMIDWGDGTAEAGWVFEEEGSFVVGGGHIYTTAGNYTVTVTVTAGDGPPTIDTATATITQASMTLSGGFRHGVIVGQESTVVVAVLEHGNPYVDEEDFTIEIDTGDGVVAGDLVPLGNGQWLVTMTHTYGPLEQGIYDVDIEVVGPHGVERTTESEVMAGDIYEGIEATLRAELYGGPDPGGPSSEYSATIYWGDGESSSGTVTGGGGIFTVTGTHTYAVDSYDLPNYPVMVVLSGPGGWSLSTTKAVWVVVPPLSGHGAEITFTPDVSTGEVVLGEFTTPDLGDAEGEYTATVDWGDGTETSATVEALGGGVYRVLGSHTYDEAGKYEYTVTVSQAWSGFAESIMLAGMMTGGPGILSKLQGPEVVPGNSIYRYAARIPYIATTQAPTVQWAVSNGMQFKIEGRRLYSSSFYEEVISVQFDNRPALVTITATYTQGGKQRTAETTVDLVKVEVRSPKAGLAFELREDGRLIIPRNAVDTNDRYAFLVPGVGVTILSNQTTLHVRTNNYNKKREGSHGLYWRAQVVLTGPPDGGKHGGVKAIKVGFVQTVVDKTNRVLLKEGAKSMMLASSVESHPLIPVYLDTETGEQPWYQHDEKSYVEGQSRLIEDFDSPSRTFPATFETIATGKTPAKNFKTDRVGNEVNFDLAVAAATSADKYATVWEEAFAKWSVDFGGKFDWKGKVAPTFIPNKKEAITKPNSWTSTLKPTLKYSAATKLPFAGEALRKQIWRQQF